jgi:hypothetical protein
MKKGIELSLNFLVTIIIALVIFAFGVKFIFNLVSDVSRLEDLTVEKIDERIVDLLCESEDRICIGVEKKLIQKGKYDIFGIRIINILGGQNFEIDIKPTKPSGYTKNGDPIPTNNIRLKYRKDIFIGKNEEESIGLAVEVPRNTKSGTYIFNVTVQPYDETHKLYVEVP